MNARTRLGIARAPLGSIVKVNATAVFRVVFVAKGGLYFGLPVGADEPETYPTTEADAHRLPGVRTFFFCDVTAVTVYAIEAHGVRGHRTAAWRKTFATAAALNKWVEKTGAEVLGTRRVEVAAY